MQAIIDIGDQKTGSKARQIFFKKNETKLLQHGCCRLKTTKVGDYDMGLAAYAGVKNHINSYLKRHSLEDIVDFDPYFEKELESELEDKRCSKVIFSFEGLMHLNVDKIEKLTSMLYRHFSEIVVIGFLRRQDRKVVSDYSTRLRNTNSVDFNICTLPNGVVRGTNYYDKFKKWSKFVPRENIIFLNYDECDDVRKTFVDAAKIPGEMVFEAVRNNRSLSALGAEVLRRFNQDLAERKEFKDKASKVRSIVKDYYSGEPLRPAKKDAEFVFEYYAESNEKLSKELGSSKKHFFDENFSEYPDDFSPIELSLSDVEEYVQQALQATR